MTAYRLWASRSLPDAPFVVCSMFSKEYRAKAERLRTSLDAINLEYAIFEVPAVHRSISPRGIGDLSFTKPEFIGFALTAFEKPVLYVDADICFRSAPDLFESFAQDFAIYNWLASDCTDAWVPIPGQSAMLGEPPRHWRFSHAIDDWSDTQMICSGCVQWWAPTPPARALLHRWRDAIRAHPRAQDDHCLDVAFNFRPKDDLRFQWLSNEYARIAFWIFSEPVIDHPDLPAPVSGDFEEIPGGQANADQIAMDAGKRIPAPRHMLLDAYRRRMIDPNAVGSAARIDKPLFLPQSEMALPKLRGGYHARECQSFQD